MRRSLVLLSVGMLCLPLLMACLSPAWLSRPWGYGDLRVLDAADADAPEVDILAVYLRRSTLDVEVRVDLLDLTFSDRYIVQLRLYDDRHYSLQPLQVTIPAQEAVEVNAPAPVRPRVVRDPWLDAITVRFNAFDLGGNIRVDVAAYLPDKDTPADEVVNVRADALPPQPAPLLLVFWNVFPASTPAQALRRWDGAHSGPDGARHGLRYILEGADAFEVPVVLLDLKTPQSLAALHFVRDGDFLRQLVERRLLILPDVIAGQPTAVSLRFNRRAAQAFGLPVGTFLYAPAEGARLISANRFLPLNDDAHLFAQGIPLPRRDPNAQASSEGLALDIRRDLIATALSPDSTDLVILGGSLPDSNWGNADFAAAAFAWIAAHPWIRVLDGEALVTFPRRQSGAIFLPDGACPASYPLYTVAGQLLAGDATAFQTTLLEALRAAPENEATRSAWQLYLQLTACTADARLAGLRVQYLGLVADLLAVARWAESPYTTTTCTLDVDSDGESECLMTNETFLALLEADGARLTFLFWRDGGSVRQLVGPTAQFAQALSDPSLWRPEYGVAVDPQAILGGFVDADAPFAAYRLEQVGERTLTFVAASGERVKTYLLLDDMLQVVYRSSSPVDVLLPLAVDPAAFFFGGAAYRGALDSEGWRWGPVDGPQVALSAGIPFSIRAFNASWPLLNMPEDPDLDYPAGHYTPFPLAIVMLEGAGDFSISLRPAH